MIDHTGLNVSDYKKSKLFYETALKPIGYKALKEIPVEYTGGVGVCGFGEPPNCDFWTTEGAPNKRKQCICA
jgi:catechol 2,3-dioxygenase-like lactoylglutathione lyase family enzyme